MIHSGSIIGGGLSQFRSVYFNKDFAHKIMFSFRDEATKVADR